MPADILPRNVVSVRKTIPIFDAMELMARHQVSGLAVVEDFMTQPAVYFEDDESLLDVCDFLKKNVFRRVPITSRGKLVGIVSISDVLEFILRLRGRVPVSACSRDG